jgi:dihydrodipicolinate synthase/N-acetylneuraminate lyase
MSRWRERLIEGLVIPACPLALEPEGSWSERYQRALVRYYVESGAGGIAIGVHTTQFAIREHGLYEPVLRLVSETLDACSVDSVTNPGKLNSFVRVAGICGDTAQAIGEAETAVSRGYHVGLLSTSAVKHKSEREILEHCRQVADEIPLFGFYLQPAVGGRVFSYNYWRGFCEIENVAAIKIAAFNRYQTIDVVRAVAESGRGDIALYTGNDDNIIVDLLTPFRFGGQTRWMAGGLLGQWAVWTRSAVKMLGEVQQARSQATIPLDWLRQNMALTDANAAIFDVANQFAGCIPGVHEVLRRQGLLPSARCLDPLETLSPGQADEITRVSCDQRLEDAFIANHLARWLA